MRMPMLGRTDTERTERRPPRGAAATWQRAGWGAADRAFAVLLGCWVVMPGSAIAQTTRPTLIDTMADTWDATDGLGRALPGLDEVGQPREGKFVGAFYFLWMGQHRTAGPYDITKILAAHPGAMTQPASPPWGPETYYHHWGEPLFGYYLSDDAWVLRKHAQMLSDAGVDAIIFDVTNQVTYEKVYLRLCEVFAAVRRDGGRTPQIAFLTPFWDPSKVVRALYDGLYRPRLHEELWFRWKGRPLILADPAKAPEDTRDFFTFRKPQPDYFQGPTGPDQWGWLEVYPQHVFRSADGRAEQMTVGVGQNASKRGLSAFSEKDTFGRSWHGGRRDERPDAVRHGLNFAEQWKRALEVDPDFIFITGWNEWIAMRLPEFAGVREPVMFVDQFTQEYSRDVEPMKGGHGDDYYHQMIGNIRRFKGVRARPRATARAITIDGSFEDWEQVRPEYRDDAGDTMHRDHPGYDNAGRYTNTTGRNDIILAKVAHDEKMVYFCVQTRAALTPATDRHWMMLLIDADHDATTGWEGYDLVVNRRPPGGSTALVDSSAGGWNWKPEGRAELRVGTHALEMALPRRLVDRSATGRPRFRFKWVDNVPWNGDIAEFTVNGDAAPNARFTYAYE